VKAAGGVREKAAADRIAGATGGETAGIAENAMATGDAPRDRLRSNWKN
jgi:hypothetical protein